MIPLNDSIYMGEVYNSVGKPFALFDANLNTIEFFGDYPAIINKNGLDSTRFNMQIVHPLLTYFIHYNDTYKKLIVAYENYDLIEIYNMNSLRKEKSIVGPNKLNFPISDDNIIQANKAVPPLEQKMGYGSISSTNNGFFVLSDNRLVKDADRWMADEIIYFEWNGEALESFKLDVEIVDFDIDTTNNLLYGISFEEENPKIYSFSIDL